MEPVNALQHITNEYRLSLALQSDTHIPSEQAELPTTPRLQASSLLVLVLQGSARSRSILKDTLLAVGATFTAFLDSSTALASDVILALHRTVSPDTSRLPHIWAASTRVQIFFSEAGPQLHRPIDRDFGGGTWQPSLGACFSHSSALRRARGYNDLVWGCLFYARRADLRAKRPVMSDA